MTYWKFALCAIILLFVIVSWDAVMLHTNVVNDQKKFEKIDSGCGHNVSKPCIDDGEGTIEVVKVKADDGNDGVDSVVHELPDVYVDGEAIKGVRADKHERFHLYLIGERHSGTNWIFDELKGCFPDMKPSTQFTRFKHWFQDEHLFNEGQIKPAIVVVMFRNVYDWIHAMNFAPHHSPAHLYMDVDKFLKKPWTMDRPRRDKAIKNKLQTNCLQKYGYNEVVPCIRGSEPPRINRTRWDRFRGWDPLYELKRDGSGRPYKSIVDLRADKIRNFMNTSNYKNVHVRLL